MWITGASSGIGEILPYLLSSHGAKLILSGRRRNELERVLKKCPQSSEKGGASCLSSCLSSDSYTNAKKSSMKFVYVQVHFDK